MKNHMTVLCGDEKDSALPTHSDEILQCPESEKNCNWRHAGRSDRSPVRLFRTDRRLPLLSNPAFHQRYCRSFSWAGIWRRHGFLHLSDPESHGYRQSAGLPRKHGGSIPGRISLPENRPLCSSLCRRDNRNRNHWGNALLSGGSPPNG